jgi:predicted enzyme related to lactoylglutathione lyase
LWIVIVRDVYEQVFGLARIDEVAGEFISLAIGEIELDIAQAPSAIAAEITISDQPRTQTSIKASFAVPDIELSRAALVAAGGNLEPAATAWTWAGATHLDGWDPDGNVFQLRQPAR